MTTAPPALPGTAWNKRLKESHEFTCLLLVKADMRVFRRIQMARPPPRLPPDEKLGHTSAIGIGIGRSISSGRPKAGPGPV